MPSNLTITGPSHGRGIIGENTLQVIAHGGKDARDLTFNASGGASVSIGPWQTTCLRIAIPIDQNVRILVGDVNVVAIATSPMFVGRGIEHIYISPGQYIAAISDDNNSGKINITP